MWQPAEFRRAREERLSGDPGIGIEKEERIRVGPSDRTVVRSAETQILVQGFELDSGVTFPDSFDGPVRRSVVHDKDLEREHRARLSEVIEHCQEVVAALVRDDYDREIRGRCHRGRVCSRSTRE